MAISICRTMNAKPERYIKPPPRRAIGRFRKLSTRRLPPERISDGVRETWVEVAMARFEEPFKVDRRRPQTPEEVRTWDHIRTVFGWEPSSIRSRAEDAEEQSACIVKVCGSLSESFEFICASGLLVGIPPKRRG